MPPPPQRKENSRTRVRTFFSAGGESARGALDVAFFRVGFPTNVAADLKTGVRKAGALLRRAAFAHGIYEQLSPWVPGHSIAKFVQ